MDNLEVKTFVPLLTAVKIQPKEDEQQKRQMNEKKCKTRQRQWLMQTKDSLYTFC